MANILIRGAAVFLRPITRLAAIAVLAWTYALSANGEEFVVAVQEVYRGDTVFVRISQERVQVRILGIDAPDTARGFGEKSKDSLARLTKGRDVRLDCVKTDKHRRKFCRAYVGDTDLGLAQIRSGMALWDREAAREQTDADRIAYEKAEIQARAGKIGLWRD